MSWKIRRDGERYYVDANTMPGAQKALHLAAAAPELLEALEKVINEYTKSLYYSDRALYLGRAVNAAEKVIAKAKGEDL